MVEITPTSRNAATGEAARAISISNSLRKSGIRPVPQRISGDGDSREGISARQAQHDVRVRQHLDQCGREDPSRARIADAQLGRSPPSRVESVSFER